MTITPGHPRRGQSNGAASMHPSGPTERSRGTHGSIGSGLGGNANWKMSSIWANGLDDSISRNSLDNISGSSSLLASSESDGWNASRNVPWPSRGQGNGMTTSPVLSRAPDRSGAINSDSGEHSGYFAKPISSGVGPSPGGGQMTYLDAGSERISPPGEASIMGNRVLHQNSERRPLNFAKNSSAGGFQAQSAYTSSLDNVRSDDMASMNISSLTQTRPDSMQQHANRNVYAHSSHNSASFAPQRPTHSSFPSFHSADVSFTDRYGTAAAELSANLERVQLNETHNAASSRPPYVSHASLDTSLNRLGYRNGSEHDGYQMMPNYSNEVSASNHQLGYHTGRSPQLVDRDLVPTPEYTHDGPYFNGRPNAPNTGRRYRNGLPQNNGPENPNAMYRMRQQNQPSAEPSYQVSNVIARQPLPASYADYSFHPQTLFTGLYPMAQINAAAALASQRPREVTSSQDNNYGPVLHEFRSVGSKGKKFELKDIYGSIVEFSGDQYGSRFLQQKLETANSDEKEKVFREIEENTMPLALDIFGNYVIQKLFEHGNQAQKKQMAERMKGQIYSLSMAAYGCRVVQKALEHVLTDQQAWMVKELEQNILRCVDDSNGNHVVQKAIERVPPKYTKFIVKAFEKQMEAQATHAFGCRVIQRMLEHCEPQDRRLLLDELRRSTEKLIEDQYGNYVIQHVIQHGDELDRSAMISVVKKDLLRYSKHKFASNVVEKSIEYGTDAERRDLIVTLTTQNSKDPNDKQLHDLMSDQYGNYVIQKVIGHLQGVQRVALIARIRPQLDTLKVYSSSKQIASIEKLINELSPQTTSAVPASNHSSTTPPNSHKSSPQPLKCSVEDRFMSTPPTPPPTDHQANGTNPEPGSEL
ncbi:armadillo-type protein [Aspergillus karnatakaensis]|uniref:mRNA-binding protein PUF3 n=1 Tax=Aspergillus karnatakaensis TaxID=1810916 RepID=UPI003CCCD47D